MLRRNRCTDPTGTRSPHTAKVSNNSRSARSEPSIPPRSHTPHPNASLSDPLSSLLASSRWQPCSGSQYSLTTRTPTWEHARRLTSNSPSHVDGQFRPLALAKLSRPAIRTTPKLRKLAHVAIYRGLPSPQRDPSGYGATRKQIAAWRSEFNTLPDSVTSQIECRPLSYAGGRPHEKGIDVLLALDLAFGAENEDWDVVVLFSADSDLRPALERAAAFGTICEIAGWAGRGPRQSRASHVSWEHRLPRRDYDAVQDSRDYRPR